GGDRLAVSGKQGHAGPPPRGVLPPRRRALASAPAATRRARSRVLCPPPSLDPRAAAAFPSLGRTRRAAQAGRGARAASAALEQLAHRTEAAAVGLAVSLAAQGLEVLRGRVALVLVEAVLWKALVEAAHLGVARRLRENRRRGDDLHLCVAVDHAPRRYAEIRAMRPVEEDLVGDER